MGNLDRASIEGSIATYVAGRVPALAGQAVGGETALLSSGLDSLGILELTMFLSEKFGVEFSDSDFEIDHFETVGSLVSFVEERIAA